MSSLTSALEADKTVPVTISPAWGILLGVVALVNGLARIVLGYHYLSHVLAGWLVGILSGLAAVYFLAPMVFTH